MHNSHGFPTIYATSHFFVTFWGAVIQRVRRIIQIRVPSQIILYCVDTSIQVFDDFFC